MSFILESESVVFIAGNNDGADDVDDDGGGRCDVDSLDFYRFCQKCVQICLWTRLDSSVGT